MLHYCRTFNIKLKIFHGISTKLRVRPTTQPIPSHFQWKVSREMKFNKKKQTPHNQYHSFLRALPSEVESLRVKSGGCIFCMFLLSAGVRYSFKPHLVIISERDPDNIPSDLQSSGTHHWSPVLAWLRRVLPGYRRSRHQGCSLTTTQVTLIQRLVHRLIVLPGMMMNCPSKWRINY